MALKDRDPVYIFTAVQNMIADMIEEAFSAVDLAFERQIAGMEDELKDEKERFAREIAEEGVVDTDARVKAFLETKKGIRAGITDIKIIQDKCAISALYIDMGIREIANTFMLVYGAAAAETPKFQLKGSGDIILKAAETKNLYVTKHEVGGSPTGAIHEAIDTVTFAVNAGKAIGDLAMAGTKLGYETKELSDTRTEAREEAEADEKSNNDLIKDIEDNKPS